MHIKNITLYPKSYPTSDVYPFNLQIFRQTDIINLSDPVTFFIGENGSGKFTLLRAMALPGAGILSFDRAPFSLIRYVETEHYRIYKAFMEKREDFIV